MDLIIDFFINQTSEISSLLDRLNMTIGGVQISWLELMVGYIALCIIIAVFWRGVRK